MSSLTTLARPYAKAAFDLAQAGDELAAWDQALASGARVVVDEAVAAWLRSPSLDRAQAVGLVAEASGMEEDSAFARFLGVLAENNRFGLLPEIGVLFGRLREQAENRLMVRVVSAIPLEPEQAERMTEALQRRFDRAVELHNEVDGGVLGGAVIYAGDQVIDGSLKGRLQKLQGSLA